MKGQTLETI